MKNRPNDILEAAVRVFSRYGVGRTRMGDIAKEAGIARQTLYGSFKNKDEILVASIAHFSEMSLVLLRDDWRDETTIEGLLLAYHARAILPSFDIMTFSTDARDMINGYNALGQQATRTAQKHKMGALQTAFAAHPDLAQADDASLAKLSEYVVLTSLGCRDLAESKPQLLRLLATLREGVLAKIQMESQDQA